MLLRVAAARWLIAELIPFGCLFGGLMLAREWTTAAGEPIGLALALAGGTLLTVSYLYKVQGTAAAWVVPVFVLMVASTIFGNVILGHGNQLVITSPYWLAWGLLLCVTALSVALAVINGERRTRDAAVLSLSAEVEEFLREQARP
jgi:hypothetical protein